jgi:hypothetical protein
MAKGCEFCAAPIKRRDLPFRIEEAGLTFCWSFSDLQSSVLRFRCSCSRAKLECGAYDSVHSGHQFFCNSSCHWQLELYALIRFHDANYP